MAHVLMLMSHSHGQDQALPLPVVVAVGRGGDREAPERVFVCKTCNRVFPSFQALGGHRASHKNCGREAFRRLSLPRLQPFDVCRAYRRESSNCFTKKPRLDGDGDPSLAKPKLHGCSIFVLEFAIGQALGGHMRRHHAMTSGMPIIHHGHDHGGVKPGGLWLDLNHPPCDDDGCDAEVECGHINAAAARITFHQFLDTGTMAVDCLGY